MATIPSLADEPGRLRFWGRGRAELFGREVDESLRGVLRLSYARDPQGNYPPGFIHASPPQQYWSGTCWPRDTGAFLRELVLWGYTAHACQTANYLMDAVPSNAEGYHSFPEYLRGRSERSEFELAEQHTYHPPTDDELDGTGAVVIALVQLWRRLTPNHPLRERIHAFLHNASSPLRHLHAQLQHSPLLIGRGEFGGGSGTEGFCSLVQNYLGALALEACARLEAAAGDGATARHWHADAERIRTGMLRYLVDDEGCWIWSVPPGTLRPDWELLNHPNLKGFGGLNAVACMGADVLGLDPTAEAWEGQRVCRRTFERLFAHPPRRQQFDRYGLWTQVDGPVPGQGLYATPSYSGGYALQTMLLHDRLDLAARLIDWLADATYNAERWGTLFTTFGTGRVSPYYFYERYCSPDAVGALDMLCGCGPLNLVNVAEPVKAARLLLGVDDTNADRVRLLPRLPAGWQGLQAEEWPILTARGVVRANLLYEQSARGTTLQLRVRSGYCIPRLAVRLPTPQGHVWRQAEDVHTGEWRVGSD
ncbi:MAG: hypothetical protein GX557_04060 [Chloroflexi bacterium]|nr:hypothetical protein [Chloroflexota bacterium]